MNKNEGLPYVEITRRSRVGWAWKTWLPDDPESPTVPVFVGTPRQVIAAIKADRLYQSVLSGGGWYIAQWFVRINRQWVPIRFDYWDTYDLYVQDVEDHRKYLYDAVTAIVER